MPSLATMFTCGGGFDVGAIAAGYTPVFGIEIDPKPAAAYRQNIGDHIVISDVRSYDFSGIKADHLHASPSCKAASTANSKRGESDFDIDCAKAVCRAIGQIKPTTFSLENVAPYAEFAAFKLILECLHLEGYRFYYRTLNSADYGVPQTRKRLILLSNKDNYPVFPHPTHSKPTQQKSLFELPDWVTWHEAIADLIPGLKKTDLAPWQRKQVDDFPRIALIEKVGARSDRPLQQISNKFPVPTLKALGQDGHWEQWVFQNGIEILRLDIRCLARLQSFPDWYQFPDSKPIACSLIGNSVPPLLAQRIMESI